MHLNDVLRFNLAVRGDQPAFLAGEDVLTHRQLEARAGRLAAFLSRTTPKGSRICVLLPNCIIYPEIFFACARAGMIIVPLGPQLMENDILRILEECNPSLFITQASQADKARGALEQYRDDALTVLCDVDTSGTIPFDWLDYREAVPLGQVSLENDASSADDPAIILFTSGTTGRPKGVVHSQANFVRGAASVLVSLGITAPGRALQVLPLAGINLVWTLSFYMAGIEVELLRRFEAEKLPRHLSNSRISHVVVAPIMLDMISRDSVYAKGCDFSHLRMLGYGGSRTPREVAIRAMEMFGPVLRQMYGQTEMSGLLTSKPAQFHVDDFDSAGVPLLGVEMRIVSPDGDDVTKTGHVGEISTKTTYSFLSYWGRTDIGAPADGWVRTGDTGRLTPQGHLVIMGRVDDMIVTGGNNVFPREVEDVLVRHPEVNEIAVVGVPDPTWGEYVTAFVVAQKGRSTDGLKQELKRIAETELASAKRPRAWHFVTALPRNPTGKVIKASLVQMATHSDEHDT